MCSYIVKIRSRGEGGGAIVSNSCETPIHATTQEGVNYLLVDGYEVDDNILPTPNNKPIPTDDTDHPVYREIWKWSDIDHRRASGCRRDAANIYGNKE